MLAKGDTMHNPSDLLNLISLRERNTPAIRAELRDAKIALRAMKKERDIVWSAPPGFLDNWTLENTLGCVLAVAVLRKVQACNAYTKTKVPPLDTIFGNFTPGRWAWHLDPVYPVSHPVPASGSHGLWRVPHEIREAVAAAVATGEPT